MGVIRLSFQLFFYTLVIGLLLMVVPGIPPDFKFDPYTIRPPRTLDGKLTPNDILDRAELVIDGEFLAPESIAFRGDEVFTGVHGGDIIRVDKNGKWKRVVKLGGDCDGSYKAECARPLGLRFNNQGKLIVAVSDGFPGIYEVDVDTGKSIQLLSTSTTPPDGVPFMLVDDLDIDKDGIIYFSDASSVTTLGNVYREALGDPTGRLLQFNPSTKAVEVLMDGIHFANGVQLSRKEDFVVVCESMRGRLWKYHLKGPKKGKKEVFVEGLPGVPDNVRSNGKGGFYVSLVSIDTEENPLLLRSFGPVPAIRKLILRSQFAILKTLELIDSLIPNSIIKMTHSYVSHLGPFGDPLMRPNKVVIVDLDETGNIIGSLQNKNGKIGYISEIALGEKYTYFGTPYDNKLWKIRTEYLA